MGIVTTVADGRRSGCLVGFHTQCSIAPPRHVVFVSKKNHTHDVAAAATALALHLPDRSERRLAEIFGELSGDDVDKFRLVEWDEGPEGLPILRGCAGWIAGHIVDRLGSLEDDHTGFVIEPFAGDVRAPLHQLGFQAVQDMLPGHEA
ncbi:MAG: flavin reductase [Actinobacteria bacterium]|nr:flavin reductase [Actinomycetota bacterium]